MDHTTRGCNITKWAWRTIQSKVLPTKGYHNWGIIHKGRSVGGHEINAPRIVLFFNSSATARAVYCQFEASSETARAVYCQCETSSVTARAEYCQCETSSVTARAV